MERPRSGDVPLFSTRMLEGEYTAYALVWSRDFGLGRNIDGILVDNYGTCYIHDAVGPRAILRTYLAVETIIPNYLFYIDRRLFQPIAYSVTRKYVLGENLGVWQQMDIWRDGVLIASINLNTDNPDDAMMVASSMSPNGKFLAFTINSVATGNNRHAMLYEGT